MQKLAVNKETRKSFPNLLLPNYSRIYTFQYLNIDNKRLTMLLMYTNHKDFSASNVDLDAVNHYSPAALR